MYQLGCVRGVTYDSKAAGTVLKIREGGVAEIDLYLYPERITAENWGDYEFTLTEDALEVLPFGVAADLLKSDDAAGNGKVYADRYAQMLQMLDPRYGMPSISVEGGVDI